LVLVFVVLLLPFFAGCTGEGGSEETTAAGTTSAPTTPAPTNQFDTVTYAEVMSITDSWDADAEDDGIIIYPALRDANDETVKWDGITLNVDIKIYTSDYDINYQSVDPRLVYSGAGTIDNWKDGNLFFSGGIKVLFDDIITTASDAEYGTIFVTVHTPVGNFEAKEGWTRIKLAE